jgi:hypothetical protein
MLFPVTSCAKSIPIERRDYILSKPHGWINLTITDTSIPNVKVINDNIISFEKPTYCTISVKVNGEKFIILDVFPDGPEAPYSVNSGFRFPVPVGEQNLAISYSGCRVDEKSETKILESIALIKIDDNMDYEFHLEHDSFIFALEKQSEEVTLKQLFDLLKNK